ncbi:MAG: hypothetical protein U0R49_06645 [Fimbriimonadales bacterium]
MIITLVPLLLTTFGSVDLAKDTRLSKPIDVRAEAEMIGELLPRLSETLKVKLEAAPSVSQHLIILLAKQRPAHEILTKISTHFGWEWEKTKDGYRLLQSEKSKREEQKRVEDTILQPYTKTQEKIKNLTKPFEPSEIEAKREELANLQKQEREFSEAYEANGAQPSDETLRKILQFEKSREEIRVRLDPVSRMCEAFFTGLSRTELLGLDESKNIVFGLNPTALQAPMPLAVRFAVGEAVQHLISNGVDTQTLLATPIEDQEKLLARSPRVKHRFSAADVKNVILKISVQNSDPRYATFVMPEAKFEVIGADNEILYQQRLSLVTYEGPWRESEPTPKFDETLDQRLPQTVELDELRGKDMWVEECKWLRVVPFSKHSKIDYLNLNAASQLAVAESINQNFIGDAHDQYGFSHSIALAPTPRAAMRELSDGAKLDLRVENGWLTNKATMYEYLRATDLPRQLVRKTRDALCDADAVDIGMLAMLVATSSDLQLRSPLPYFLLDTFGHQPFDLNLRLCSLLRTYHFSTASQKLALKSGQPLQRQLMSPFAQRQFDRFCTLSEWQSGFLREERFYANTEAASYSKTVWTGLALNTIPGVTYTYELSQWFPQGIPGAATFSIALWKEPAFTTRNENGTTATQRASNYVDSLFSERMDRRTDAGRSVKLAESALYALTAQLSANAKRGVMLTITRELSGTEFGPHATLPADIRKMIDDEVARRIKEIGGGG